MGNLDFDASGVVVEQKADFAPLPDGIYVAEIQEGVIKQGKKTGENYLSLSLKCLDENRWVWDNFMLWFDSSPSAKEMGNKRFAELARALGLTKIADTDDIVLKKVQVRLATEPAKDGYAAKNKIVNYLPIEQSAPPTAAVDLTTDDAPMGPWAG